MKQHVPNLTLGIPTENYAFKSHDYSLIHFLFTKLGSYQRQQETLTFH